MTRWSLWFPLVLKDPAKSTEDKQTENPSLCNKKLSLPRKADNLNRQDRLGWEKGCVISVSQMGNRGTERLSDLHKVCVRARNGSQISWILCHCLNNKTIFSLSCHSLEREGPVLSYTKLHHCLQGNLIKCYACSIHLVFWFLLLCLFWFLLFPSFTFPFILPFLCFQCLLQRTLVSTTQEESPSVSEMAYPDHLAFACTVRNIPAVPGHVTSWTEYANMKRIKIRKRHLRFACFIMTKSE